MELAALRDTMLAILGIDSVDGMSEALMLAAMSGDERVLDAVRAAFPDLSRDWLRPLFQYYLADREQKKQDFTPASLAALMNGLAGKAETLVDMCAGSGALTISAWAADPQRSFELFEVDGQVVSFLIFNLVLRNMNATVHHQDVLQGREFALYTVSAGKKYSSVKVLSFDDKSVCQQSAVQYGMEKTDDRQGSLLAL